MGRFSKSRESSGAVPGSREWYDLLPERDKNKLSPCCFGPLAKREVSFVQVAGPEVVFAWTAACVKCDGAIGELHLQGNWVPPGWTEQAWAIMREQKTTTGRYKCRQHKNGTIIPKYVDGESFDSFLEHSPRVNRFLRGRKPDEAITSAIQKTMSEKRKAANGYQPEPEQQEIPWAPGKETEANGD